MKKELQLQMGRLQKVKNKGFTLVETIIILFVFCLIFTIPSLKLTQFKSDLELSNTTRLVKSIIESSTRKSLLEKNAIFIHYSEENNRISVKQGKSMQYFPINHQIKIDNLNHVFVNPKGSISPCTIMIKNKNKKRMIKIQMKWGRMIES